MVQKLVREGDAGEKSCVCDAAQCNPLTIIPMGLSAGFVALGSTAPVLPLAERVTAQSASRRASPRGFRRGCAADDFVGQPSWRVRVRSTDCCCLWVRGARDVAEQDLGTAAVARFWNPLRHRRVD